MISIPASSLGVMISTFASCETMSQASWATPSMRPATQARAKPAPMLSATCIMETGPSNSLTAPLGRVIFNILHYPGCLRRILRVLIKINGVAKVPATTATYLRALRTDTPACFKRVKVYSLSRLTHRFKAHFFASLQQYGKL